MLTIERLPPLRTKAAAILIGMGLLRDLLTAFVRTRKRLRDGDLPEADDDSESSVALPTADPPAEHPRRHEDHPLDAAAGYTVWFDLESIRSFPRLETRAMRVVGLGHYLTGTERHEWVRQAVVLLPEPGNPVDTLAVAVARPDGRKVGYISAGTAKQYQPVLLNVGPVKVISRRDGMKLWVDVPRLPELRKATR